MYFLEYCKWCGQLAVKRYVIVGLNLKREGVSPLYGSKDIINISTCIVSRRAPFPIPFEKYH